MRALSVIFFSFIVIIVTSACANSHVDKATMAIGEVAAQDLLANHKSFQLSYQEFSLSEQEILEIKRWPSDLQIEVYFGTWCHDSHREVPRFLKVVAENSAISHRLIGLDYEKSEPKGSAKKHDVNYTPTFIVYKDNKEIGRIIERPAISLTADISAML